MLYGVLTIDIDTCVARTGASLLPKFGQTAPNRYSSRLAAVTCISPTPGSRPSRVAGELTDRFEKFECSNGRTRDQVYPDLEGPLAHPLPNVDVGSPSEQLVRLRVHGRSGPVAPEGRAESTGPPKRCVERDECAVIGTEPISGDLRRRLSPTRGPTFRDSHDAGAQFTESQSHLRALRRAIDAQYRSHLASRECAQPSS